MLFYMLEYMYMSLKTCHWESFLMAATDGLRLCMDLVATQHVISDMLSVLQAIANAWKRVCLFTDSQKLPTCFTQHNLADVRNESGRLQKGCQCNNQMENVKHFWNNHMTKRIFCHMCLRLQRPKDGEQKSLVSVTAPKRVTSFVKHFVVILLSFGVSCQQLLPM